MTIGQGRWDLNDYGVAVKEAGAPDTALAPASDPRAANWTARPKGAACRDDTHSSSSIDEYTLLLEYAPSDAAAAQAALARLAALGRRRSRLDMAPALFEDSAPPAPVALGWPEQPRVASRQRSQARPHGMRSSGRLHLSSRNFAPTGSCLAPTSRRWTRPGRTPTPRAHAPPHAPPRA